MKCDACNREAPTQVTCSGLGPFSLAYCEEYGKRFAEPDWAIAHLMAECDFDMDRISDGVKNVVTFFRDNEYHKMVDWKPL